MYYRDERVKRFLESSRVKLFLRFFSFSVFVHKDRQPQIFITRYVVPSFYAQKQKQEVTHKMKCCNYSRLINKIIEVKSTLLFYTVSHYSKKYHFFINKNLFTSKIYLLSLNWFLIANKKCWHTNISYCKTSMIRSHENNTLEKHIQLVLI